MSAEVRFYADPALCIACGKCVNDCPARVLALVDGRVVPLEDFDEDCIDCQHCLSICPTAAASVGGRNPADSQPITPVDPAQIDKLFRSRRSFRKFAPEPVNEELLEKIMESTGYAPTGVNARQRRFTLITDPAVLHDFRDKVCRLLVERAPYLPDDISWLANAASKWLEKGRDVIFRNAPNMLVVTAGPYASTAQADCLIALSYFELAAQANGLGTVWVGMVQYLLEFLPEARMWLNIPENHTLGYAMLFGKPAVQYQRTTQWQPEQVMVVERLQQL